MELYETITQKSRELDTAIKQLRKSGEDLAQAEHDYKVKLSQEALKMNADKVKATLIDLCVHGLENVADLRLKRDIAKAKYTANLEFINVCKLQIKLLENQLAREYGQAGKGI